MADAKKIDPFDVEALEKSLNDSATRVSTIWVSFLIFSLYLLTAATTVTDRQLLLAEPVKLPVLNIDLPLWGFFFLAPILLVIFHIYVLLQVLLLGRTAAPYNEAIDGAVKSPPSNAAMRQRLANTLFAQIFAGSPREREGPLGWLLKAMAWITLAISPILILLAFQFSFLAYHSHIATWTHRLLVLIELLAFLWIWPLALDARKDFRWPNIGTQLKRLVAALRQLFIQKDGHPNEYLWFREQLIPLSAFFAFIVVSLLLATFPGEPHINLLTGQSLSSVQCERWFFWTYDRLRLPQTDVADDEKLARISQSTSDRGLREYEGERTRDFQDRDFNCSDLSGADLRRVDMTGTKLSGAMLSYAELNGASLYFAKLQGADLRRAKLQGALLAFAQLQGASLDDAQMQGTSLFRAKLQGASLNRAELKASLLLEAALLGASLDGAQLQGADLSGALLQGASVDGTRFHGASLDGAQLQGIDFSKSSMAHTDLSNAYVWRAKGLQCTNVRVKMHKPDAVIESKIITEGRHQATKVTTATPDEIAKFIERSTASILDKNVKERTGRRMSKSLVTDATIDDAAKLERFWIDCEEVAKNAAEEMFYSERASFLRSLACEARVERKTITRGTIDNWIELEPSRGRAQLARGLLGEDGKECAATKDIDEVTRGHLRAAIADTTGTPPSPPKPLLQ